MAERKRRLYRADPAHDPFARECVQVGVPASDLHDGSCPACRVMSSLVDLDPDFGPADLGRPPTTDESEAS